jgi:hypothetical protein
VTRVTRTPLDGATQAITGTSRDRTPARGVDATSVMRYSSALLEQ